MALRLFLADDHALFRSGLRALLEAEEGFELVGEASDGESLFQALPGADFDVLILDIGMPGPTVGQVITRVRNEKPDAAVVVLTMHEEEYSLREALQAGAGAFVLKKSTATELAVAIRSAARGRRYVDPALSHLFVSLLVHEGPLREPHRSTPLTPREEEVLRYLSLGHTNREIAERLCISKRTVETHRASSMEKLGFKTRAELVGYALEKGLLSADRGGSAG